MPNDVNRKAPASVDASEAGGEESSRQAYVEVRFQNSTDGLIDEMAVLFGKHRCTFGMINAGHSATYLRWPRPIGTNAIVQWRDGKKVRREVDVRLTNVYDKRAPGRLTFTVKGTNATVSFEGIERR